MTRHSTSQSRTAGFTLIEMMVAIVISLVLTLAITNVLMRTEGSKRNTTSVNEVNATGAYSAFVLDRAIRSAGSGFSQRWQDVYGCRVSASSDGVDVMPMPAAFPATSAFARVPQQLRLAPLLIGKGLADRTTGTPEVRGDVLVVMGGMSGSGESPLDVLAPPGGVLTQSNLRVPNTLGYADNDMLLLANTASPGAGCLMEQVGTHNPAVSDQALPLSGQFFTTSASGVSLSDFGGASIAVQMGNAVGNLPVFQLYGVGNNASLMGYDLLRPAAAAASGGVAAVNPEVAVAEGVVEMRALYRIDRSLALDGSDLAWIDPVADYSAANLSDGSPAAQTRVRRIVAVRVGMILRTTVSERPQDFAQPAGKTFTLFADAIPQARTLVGDELTYRYRTVDVTIPLRNVLLAPQL